MIRVDVDVDVGLIPSNGDREVKAEVFFTAADARNRAIKSIMRGPKTGAAYRRGSKWHVASAPGQAPATDTGLLASSINVKQLDGGFASEISALADYAGYLEFGTRRMDERPFMRPALDAALDGFETRLLRRLAAAGVTDEP